MVKIYIFLYIKIIDNILLRTFPTPPEKNLNSPEPSQSPPPQKILNPPPPRKFLKSPPHKNF